MTPEQRAERVAERLADEWELSHLLQDDIEDHVTDAIRAAVEAERAKYRELVEAADEIYRLTERSTVIWDRYKNARKELP